MSTLAINVWEEELMLRVFAHTGQLLVNTVTGPEEGFTSLSLAHGGGSANFTQFRGNGSLACPGSFTLGFLHSLNVLFLPQCRTQLGKLFIKSTPKFLTVLRGIGHKPSLNWLSLAVWCRQSYKTDRDVVPIATEQDERSRRMVLSEKSVNPL